MPTLFRSVAVVEVAEATALDELLAAGLDRFVVRRLGPKAAMVDHERLDDVHKLLKRLGQTPRVTAE
ncbi:MAG TPA: hypothetical protein VNL16_08725 [Chloroflexota bacterium]|nr:hypothetical protein [Chloroflexota bacterium]